MTLRSDAMNGDTVLARFVDQVLGDARTGEGDDALRQQVQQLVVAPEGRCLAVAVPIGLADHLVDVATFRPLGGDAFGTRSAAVEEDHVIVFCLRLVELLPDGVGIADVLAAGEGDEGALGQMRAGLFILAGADEVAGVDGGGG